MSRKRCPKCKEKQEEVRLTTDLKFDGRGGVKYRRHTAYYCDNLDCDLHGLLTLASVVKEEIIEKGERR